MKRLIAFIFLCFVVSLQSLAYAHPPSDISITYHPSTKILVAVIIHNVNDPVRHYIKKVDIGLNGKEIIQQEISRQDNNSTQTITYMIPDALPGDTVSVEGYCSISGKLEKEIKASDK
jgi:hypothetical protein